MGSWSNPCCTNPELEGGARKKCGAQERTWAGRKRVNNVIDMPKVKYNGQMERFVFHHLKGCLDGGHSHVMSIRPPNSGHVRQPFAGILR